MHAPNTRIPIVKRVGSAEHLLLFSLHSLYRALFPFHYTLNPHHLVPLYLGCLLWKKRSKAGKPPPKLKISFCSTVGVVASPRHDKSFAWTHGSPELVRRSVLTGRNPRSVFLVLFSKKKKNTAVCGTGGKGSDARAHNRGREKLIKAPARKSLAETDAQVNTITCR